MCVSANKRQNKVHRVLQVENFEAANSEFLENIQEIFPRYLYRLTLASLVGNEQMTVDIKEQYQAQIKYIQ